jgi:DNA-binding NarL/FixJ family response regulator
MPITLIAADDHRMFLEGLKSLIELTPECRLLATADNADELLEKVSLLQPDIVLLDLSMPGAATEKVIEACEKLEKPPRLIAVTMHMDARRAEELMALGLSGYVLKEEAFDDLYNAIRAVFSGEQFISPGLMAVMSSAQGAASEKSLLTERERSVLELVAEGLSNMDIATALRISDNGTFSPLQLLCKAQGARPFQCGCQSDTNGHDLNLNPWFQRG